MSTPISGAGGVTGLGDRYRIEREVGSGGMATVYLAEDLRHRRRVAVKVLHPELSAVLGPERFLKEIELTASLQHPHILPLFDSGESNGTLFYVMPFIDGETLRARIERERQLPINDAIRIARDIADALTYAHRRGLVHRDIKPENILIHEGRPLLADFGIALAVQQAGGQRMTQTGLSLGTPQYMAPEQATGERNVDHRADVYALAAVLYEMLAGEPPFSGPSAQAVVARVLTEKPVALHLRRERVAPHVEDAIMTALEKLPADRFASAAEFSDALEDATRPTRARTGASAGSPPAWKQLLPLAGAVTIAAAALGWGATRGDQGARLTEYDVGLPDSLQLPLGYAPNFSIAADGEYLIISGGSGRALWRRSLRDAGATPIPGAAGLYPRLSPAGTHAAFVTNEALPKMQLLDLRNGRLRDMGGQLDIYAVMWTSDSRFLAIGGDGTVLNTYDVERGLAGTRVVPYCILPSWVPGLGRILCGGGSWPYPTLLDPATGDQQPLRSSQGEAGAATELRGAHFRVVADRYLVYVSVGGDLRGASFDAAALTVGPSVLLIPSVRRESYTGAGQYDIAANGTLAYIPGENAEIGQFVVGGGADGPAVLPIEADAFLRFDISPDGQRVAAVSQGAAGQELRVYNLRDGRRQLWTSATEIGHPLWLPDGERLVFGVTDRAGRRAMLVGTPNSARPPDTLVAGGRIETGSAGRDGTLVGWGEAGGSLLASNALRLHTGGDARLDTLMRNVIFASASPDERWLVYEETNPWAMYLSPYPALDRKFDVTREGGEGRWRSPTELVFWIAGAGGGTGATWYRVRVDPTAADPVGQPVLWFSDPRMSDTPGYSYRLTPDGRALYLHGPARSSAPFVRVVPNWVEAMKRAVDGAR